RHPQPASLGGVASPGFDVPVGAPATPGVPAVPAGAPATPPVPVGAAPDVPTAPAPATAGEPPEPAPPICVLPPPEPPAPPLLMPAVGAPATGAPPESPPAPPPLTPAVLAPPESPPLVPPAPPPAVPAVPASPAVPPAPPLGSGSGSGGTQLPGSTVVTAPALYAPMSGEPERVDGLKHFATPPMLWMYSISISYCHQFSRATWPTIIGVRFTKHFGSKPMSVVGAPLPFEPLPMRSIAPEAGTKLGG